MRRGAGIKSFNSTIPFSCIHQVLQIAVLEGIGMKQAQSTYSLLEYGKDIALCVDMPRSRWIVDIFDIDHLFFCT